MFLFRLDAGPKIGFGHLFRCRSIAQSLITKGQSCIMIGPDKIYCENLDKKLFKKWIPMKWSNSTIDAEKICKIGKKFNTNKVILDDYRVDETYQLILKKNKFKWLQFESRFNNKILADIILNASPGAKKTNYNSSILNKNVKFLLGPNYAPLRTDFKKIKRRNSKRAVKNILLTFGGGDDKGVIRFVLNNLIEYLTVEKKIKIISGLSNPNNSNIKKWIKKNGFGKVELKINPENVPEIISSCDLAIINGGMTSYEVAYVGLPMIIITTAENQKKNAEAWVKKGSAVYAGSYDNLSKKKLIDSFNNLVNSSKIRALQCISSKKITKGFGSDNVASKLIELKQAKEEF